MNKGVIIGITATIGVLIALGVILSFEKSDVIEDVVDREILEEITPEIQGKLDDIEKINLENKYSPKPRDWITSGPFQMKVGLLKQLKHL